MEEPTTTTLPGVRIAGGVSRWRRPHFALKIAFSLLTGTKFAEMRDVCVAFGSFVLGHKRFSPRHPPLFEATMTGRYARSDVRDSDTT